MPEKEKSDTRKLSEKVKEISEAIYKRTETLEGFVEALNMRPKTQWTLSERRLAHALVNTIQKDADRIKRLLNRYGMKDIPGEGNCKEG